MLPTTSIRIALIGIGKIARDQHIPALTANDRFEIVASVSRNASLDGYPHFAEIDAFLASGLACEAVSICTPPQGRYAIARAAIDAGLHVMLEKPPGTTVSEVVDLAARARAARVSLFTSWHSRAAIGVEPARAWLEKRAVRKVRIDWKEDIRVWHPGQDWILEARGMGVFDPGINALSIATRILPGPLLLQSARLDFPANRAAPIAASLEYLHDGVAPVEVTLDFLQTGPQSWDIEVQTDDGVLTLSGGGQQLSIDGLKQTLGPNDEYPQLYRHFAELVDRQESDVDLSPLQHVADVFMLGKRAETAAFNF